MIAIILAAGYGNRMRPFTDNEHKTLLKINNVTIIDNIIDSLIKNSIKNIVLVTGYRSEELKKYLIVNYKKINFRFVNNEDYRKTNNIYSLSLAFKNININTLNRMGAWTIRERHTIKIIMSLCKLKFFLIYEIRF